MNNKNQKTLCNNKSGVTKSSKQQEEAFSMNIDSSKMSHPEDTSTTQKTKKNGSEKSKRGRKKADPTESDSNLKINTFININPLVVNAAVKSLSINSELITNNNNNCQMNPREGEDFKMIEVNEQTPSRSRVERGNKNSTTNMISTENSKRTGVIIIQESESNFGLPVQSNIVNNLNNNISSTNENNDSILTRLRKKIITYSQESVDCRYNFERCIIENEEALNTARVPDYFKQQRYIDVRMRVILVDWIMEVCSQLSFKRATYHMAVVLLDVFLSKMPDLRTNFLQLLGVTCLIIAAKNEEIVIPNFEAFSHSTDYAYTVKDMLTYERHLLASLNWRIHFPNLAFWSNYTTIKWDEFTSEFNTKYAYDLGIQNSLKLPRFRSHSSEEYFLFRNYFQLMDVISLDYTSLNYSEKILSAAVIYLLIGLFLKYFDIAKIVKEFTKDSSLFATYYDLNMIFNRFLLNYLNCEFDDLSDHMVYVSFFFNMTFDYASPEMPKDDENEKKIVTQEEYLQIQTHNRHNIRSVENIIAQRNSVAYGNGNN